MLQQLRARLASIGRTLGNRFGRSQFGGTVLPPVAGGIVDPEAALTLSPWWAGVRFYMQTIGSLPLVVYRTDTGSRVRAETLPVYQILGQRPNPAMSRPVFIQQLVLAAITEGEAFAQVQTDGNGYLTGLYPIPKRFVINRGVDAEWNKAFEVQLPDQPREILVGREMLHILWHSRDGLYGVPPQEYAAEALGLHKQVQTSANAYYRNAARPSGFVRYPGRLTRESVEQVRAYFAEAFAGVENTGRVPVLGENGSFERFDSVNARDAEIIAALSASVDDCARWLNLSPLILFNLQRGTYSNLAADNAATYQRSIRPVLDLIEAELNWCVFGARAPLYAEFLTEAIMRGDPETQARVADMGIRNGSITRNEQRGFLNLPALPGLDAPGSSGSSESANPTAPGGGGA